MRRASRNGAPFWMVSVRRQNKTISRSFTDGVYGSSEEALAIARRWRDAILMAIPPRTNLDIAKRPNGASATGHTGVYYTKDAEGRIKTYEARLGTPFGVKRKKFSCGVHGRRKAYALAVAQRQEWLAQAPVMFMARAPEAVRRALRDFPDLLEPTPEPKILSPAQVRARIEEIDRRFDTLRPVWLNVHVRVYENTRLAVRVSEDSGGQVRRTHVFEISFRRDPLEQALSRVLTRVTAAIGELFGHKTARSFRELHGSTFHIQNFDCAAGIRLRLRQERPARTGARRQSGAESSAGPRLSAAFLGRLGSAPGS